MRRHPGDDAAPFRSGEHCSPSRRKCPAILAAMCRHSGGVSLSFRRGDLPIARVPRSGEHCSPYLVEVPKPSPLGVRAPGKQSGGLAFPFRGRWREAPEEVVCRIARCLDRIRMQSTADEDLIRLAALGTFPRGEGFWKYCECSERSPATANRSGEHCSPSRR